MMSENKNLWIGLLLGMALTALLMFVLYKQVAPLEALQQPTEKALKRPAIIPKIPDVSYSVKPEKPLPAAKKQQPEQMQSQSTSSKQGSTIEKGSSAAEATAIGLPEGLDLSKQELESLSESERKEYDAMLASYREVRERVLRLHREREELQQRMDKMFEQNETMERKLGEMQEVVNQQQEAKTSN